MSRFKTLKLIGILSLGMMMADPSRGVAQTADLKKPRKITAVDADKKPTSLSRVVIRREPLRLIDPKTFDVALFLEPIRSIDLSPEVDGIVRSVRVKPGERVKVQSEAVRLDNRVQQLLLERAKANYAASQIEIKLAQRKPNPNLVELAEARLRAAKADLDLAELRLERTQIRVPFAGEVFRVQAVEGQFVRAGQPLVTIGDTSRLKVEIPVDRKKVASGQTIKLRVEDVTIKAKVESILPLRPQFKPLRALLNSVATAVVVVDNSQGRLKAWQAVYSPLIPRHWVTEIPTACLKNLDRKNPDENDEFERKVQVIRKNVIRDLPVQLLGQVGAERIFVSGTFAIDDEVIVESSDELADGTQIQQATASVKKMRKKGSGAKRRNSDKKRPNF